MRLLLVSLVLLLGLLGLLLASEIRNYRTASQTPRIVSVTLSVQDAIQNLQRERGLTNGLLGGTRQYRQQLATQRTQTDAALGSLNRTINDPGNAAAGAAEARAALDKLAELPNVRGEVDDDRAQAAPTFQFYTDAIVALNGLDLGLDGAQDGTLRHEMQALYALGDAKEFTAREGGLLNGVFAAGSFSTANYLSFAEYLGQKGAALASYDSFATADERDMLAAVLRSSVANQAASYESIAIGGASATLPSQVDPQAWWNAMTTVVDDMRDVQQSVGGDVTARGTVLREDAMAWLVGTGVLAALTVSAMIALVVGAARSIVGPLGALARQADEVSSRRLPEAIATLHAAGEGELPPPADVVMPARAVREIRQVAQALDRVQHTAWALVREQALIRRSTTASLANLGRRNQNLLRRQLGLISECEHEELDPAALANLFELDHLATRMRRNAESLLVLAGESSPRTWAQPLSVTDVIRAALSEVEEYRRVLLRRVDEAYISGTAVTEIAHMLAELVENGLSFSSPDLEVEIYGRRSSKGYLLVVVDHGVGMPPADLARARLRLRDEENFLVAPTRFLGHYVVGRLANRLSVRVELSESPVSGITARLRLPTDLLADPPAGTADSTPPQPPATTSGTPDARNAVAARPTAAIARNGRPAADPLSTPGQRHARHAQPSPPVTGSGHGRGGPHGQHAAMGPSTDVPAHQRVGHPVAAATRPEPERTRNGLVKRQPQASSTAVGTPPPRSSAAEGHLPDLPLVDGRYPPATPQDRSPAEVGSMLAAFRQGHQRGESAARQPTPTGPNPTMPDAGHNPSGEGGGSR